MKSTRFRIVLSLFLVLAWAATDGYAATVKHVVIISLDGGRPDVILASQTPNLHEMARDGAATWWAQTVDPSITLVAHASMLTGFRPKKHGITWNDWQPAAGFVKVSTCFEIAKAAGLKTAMFVGKEKLRHLAKPQTVDRFETTDGSPVAISKAAQRYFVENKPNLLFVHYALPDTVGHAAGWGTKAQRAAFEQCDQGIGLLRQAVRQAHADSTTLFIISADHGGHEQTHGTTDIRDMTIPWIAYGPGVIKPGEIQQSVNTCDTAPTALHALGLKPDPDCDGKAITVIFLPRQSADAK